MRLIVLATFLLLSLVAFVTSLLARTIACEGMYIGAKLKGCWDHEDNFWVSNTCSSKSRSLFACLLSIFTSSYLASYKLTCVIFKFFVLLLFIVKKIWAFNFRTFSKCTKIFQHQKFPKLQYYNLTRTLHLWIIGMYQPWPTMVSSQFTMFLLSALPMYDAWRLMPII